jgi:hypothetical protein
MMLLIDGVKYKLWMPKREDELEGMVKEHAKDIFGTDSLYLDLKQKLKSKAGIGSIPDGYVITFEDKPRWHIVEVELSSHPLYEHVVVQITKFMNGMTNPYSQRMIIDAIDEEISKDEVLKAWVKTKIGSQEIHRFLSNLISNPPIITIIIDEKTDELEEVCNSLPGEKKIVEFKTFEREGVGMAVHAHLFQPLYKGKEVEERKVGWQGEGYTLVYIEGDYEVYEKEGEFSIEKPPSRKVVAQGLRSLEEAKRKVSALQSDTTTLKSIDLIIQKSWVDYKYLYVAKDKRGILPSEGIEFDLETDIGTVRTKIEKEPSKGQMWEGLRPWFKHHPELEVGGKLTIEAIEPMKKYRLQTYGMLTINKVELF